MKDKRLIERTVLNSKNPAQQIIIEADLRLINPYTIKNMLVDLGHEEFKGIEFKKHVTGFWDIAESSIKINPNMESGVLKLYHEQLNDIEISKKLRISTNSVASIRAKYNLESWKVIKAREKETEILNLYNQGLSDKQIAKKADVSHQLVVNTRLKHNLKSNIGKGRPQKEFKQANHAMELYNKGLNDMQIARELKVSLSEVYRWRVKSGLNSNFSNKPRKNAAQLGAATAKI